MQFQRQNYQGQSSSQLNPFLAGVGTGVAGDRAVMAFQQINKRSKWGVGLGATSLLSQFLGGQQASTQAQNAAAAAAAANALAFTSGGATGLETAALRQQVVILANAVALGLSNMNPMVELGLQAQQAPVTTPSAAIAAGSGVTTAQTASLGGILLAGVLLFAVTSGD